MNLCMSHSATTRLLDKVGESFNSEVLRWKEHLLDLLPSEAKVYYYGVMVKFYYY